VWCVCVLCVCVVCVLCVCGVCGGGGGGGGGGVLAFENPPHIGKKLQKNMATVFPRVRSKAAIPYGRHRLPNTCKKSFNKRLSSIKGNNSWGFSFALKRNEAKHKQTPT